MYIISDTSLHNFYHVAEKRNSIETVDSYFTKELYKVRVVLLDMGNHYGMHELTCNKNGKLYGMTLCEIFYIVNENGGTVELDLDKDFGKPYTDTATEQQSPMEEHNREIVQQIQNSLPPKSLQLTIPIFYIYLNVTIGEDSYAPQHGTVNMSITELDTVTLKQLVTLSMNAAKDVITESEVAPDDKLLRYISDYIFSNVFDSLRKYL